MLNAKKLKKIVSLSLAVGILSFSVGASAKAIGYVTRADGVKYEYCQEDLITSIIAKSRMYDRYRSESLLAIVDDKKGYIDADDVINAIVQASIRGERFSVDAYLESDEAKRINLSRVIRVGPDGENILDSSSSDSSNTSNGTAIYDEEGNLIYLGEVVQGKPHGKGKSFGLDGTVLYDGDWRFGVSHGKGTSYYSDGQIRYTGDWKNDKADGFGVEHLADGTKLYSGEWSDGAANGKGQLFFADGSVEYDGYWQDDFFHGEGTWYNTDGTIHLKGVFNFGEIDNTH